MYPDLFALSQQLPSLDYRTPTPTDRMAVSVGIRLATLTLKHMDKCRHQTSRFAVRGADGLEKIEGGIGTREVSTRAELMKGESAALEPLPNFPDGIEGSIVRKRMSRAVKKSATIFNLIFLLKPCATLPY